jgi:hypothetical protein
MWRRRLPSAIVVAVGLQEVPEPPAAGQQLVVWAGFDDSPGVEHHDGVHLAQR